MNQSDLLLATDPDCDRVDIAVRSEDGEYVLLTGNETGYLLLEYILSQKQASNTLPGKTLLLPKSDVIVLSLESEKELVVRPSGTESKLKCYLTASGKDSNSSINYIEAIEESIRQYINGIVK